MYRLKPIQPDFILHDLGSIVVINPASALAHDWKNRNINPAALRFGDAIVAEPVYAEVIVKEITSAGLKVAA